MSPAEKYKNILSRIIDEMAKDPSRFAANPGHDFTRRRKLPFDALLKFLISAGGNTLGIELYNFFRDNGENALDCATPSAYVQQMAKLAPGTMKYAFRQFNEQCGVDPVKEAGYRALAVDGCALSIAKNENADSYVKLTKGVYGNQIAMNLVVDVLNKTIDDCFNRPKGINNERAAFLGMLKERPPVQDTIYIMDRGYGSFNLFETLNRTPHAEYIVRVQNKFCGAISRLPYEEFDKDITVEIRTTQTKEDNKLYASGEAVFAQGFSKHGKQKKHVNWPYESPFKLTMRVVRVKIGESGSKDEYETIITSLDRFRFPPERIKELYYVRWKAETSFRDLKYSIGLINVHSRKEEYVDQEVYARLIAFNFVSRISACIVIDNDCGRKYTYAVDFKTAAYICMEFFRCISMRAPPGFEEGIGKFLHPIRPGRSDMRKLKKKGWIPFVYRVA